MIKLFKNNTIKHNINAKCSKAYHWAYNPFLDTLKKRQSLDFTLLIKDFFNKTARQSGTIKL